MRQIYLYFFRNVVFVETALAFIVAAVCWFENWRSLAIYGNGLLVAGVVLIGLGLAFISGGVQNNDAVLILRFFGSDIVEHDRISLGKQHLDHAYFLANFWHVAGFIAILFGSLISIFFH